MSADTLVRPAEGGSARLKGFGYLLITAISWGANWPILKFLLGEGAPFTLRVMTSIVGLLFIFPLALVLGERLAVPRRLWGKLTMAAVLNFSAFTICSTMSLRWLSASEAVIIAYTLPMWGALLAWPLLGERPTVRRIVALLIGMSGVVVLVGADLRTSWATLPGVAFALAGSILFALGTVRNKSRPIGLAPITLVAWQVAIGTIPLFALSLFESHDLSRVSRLGWISVAYIGVIPLCLAYLAWFRALRLLPASVATIGTLMVPMIGVSSSALMLAEPIGPRQIAALALTLFGVALAARG